MPAESDKNIREKIAGLDVLPEGVAFNSAHSWQQVEQALQPAKKRTAKWYYAAAVFLGVAATLLVLMKDHEQPAVVFAAKAIAPYKHAPVVAQNVPVNKKNAPAPKKIIASPHTRESISAATPVMQSTGNNDLPQMTAVMKEQASPAPIKLIVTTAHKEPVKPNRLKIVHLNELGVEQEMIYTRAPSKKIQALEELPEEQAASQINKAWWQPKPKPVTTITDHP